MQIDGFTWDLTEGAEGSLLLTRLAERRQETGKCAGVEESRADRGIPRGKREIRAREERNSPSGDRESGVGWRG